jgi:hypothetical protein
MNRNRLYDDLYNFVNYKFDDEIWDIAYLNLEDKLNLFLQNVLDINKELYNLNENFILDE